MCSIMHEVEADVNRASTYVYMYVCTQAGKLIPRGHGAKECLVVTHGNGGQPQTPELVKKFRHPEPGQARMFQSPTGDTNIDDDVCHGVKTKSSLEVA